MDSSLYASFRRKIRSWFTRHGRDLPWRRTRDPYQIWISEIMLQQTTVTAVIPYFNRFLSHFPTLQDLAAAQEAQVLQQWEGLGYYSRARNIHKAARQIVERFQGDFPDDPEILQSLSGIGRYTAGAIASFAFDRPAPIVEANTLRLYARLLGYAGDPRSSEGQRLLWSFAERILPRKAPGQLNQALMELGSTVCTPRDPACDRCPVREFCRAFQDGTQSVIPRPKSRVAVTQVTEVSIAVFDDSRVLLRKRTENERWAGLWDFVRFEIDAVSPTIDLDHLTQSVLERTGLSIEIDSHLTEMKHAVTRYQITLKCITAKRIKGRLKPTEEWNWVKPTEFQHYPLSVTARRFAEKLASQPAQRSPAITGGRSLPD